jgi:hypothetical protein
VPRGHLVAWEQFQLPVRRRPRLQPPVTAGGLEVQDGAYALVVSGERFTLRFAKDRGEIDSWVFDGVELLRQGPVPDFWRAPTDNDFGNGFQVRTAVWKAASENRQLVTLTRRTLLSGALEVTSTFALDDVSSSLIVRSTVFGSGTILIDSELTPRDDDLPELPRFGMTLRLPKSFDHVQWYGRGPHESYWDRKSGARVGLYEGTVMEQYQPYVRPQENGNKTDVRWMALTNSEGRGLLAVGLPLLSASAHHFATADFDPGPEKAQRHTVDLVARDFVSLHLDYKQTGVGGDNSWGAVTHREYTVLPQPLAYSYCLRPFSADDGEPAALARQVFHTSAMASTLAERTLELDDFGERNLSRHLARGRPVEVTPEMTSPYSRNGNAGLVDGVRGSIDRRGGDWQGYETKAFEAIVDLGEIYALKQVKTGFLQNPWARIFLPKSVTYAVSGDGRRFREVGSLGHDVALLGEDAERYFFTQSLDGIEARYVRVRAKSIGVCPKGHDQAGEPVWLYVDEIIVD